MLISATSSSSSKTLSIFPQLIIQRERESERERQRDRERDRERVRELLSISLFTRDWRRPLTEYHTVYTTLQIKHDLLLLFKVVTLVLGIVMQVPSSNIRVDDDG